jgi:hypothetical protein
MDNGLLASSVFKYFPNENFPITLGVEVGGRGVSAPASRNSSV